MPTGRNIASFRRLDTTLHNPILPLAEGERHHQRSCEKVQDSSVYCGIQIQPEESSLGKINPKKKGMSRSKKEERVVTPGRE